MVKKKTGSATECSGDYLCVRLQALRWKELEAYEVETFKFSSGKVSLNFFWPFSSAPFFFFRGRKNIVF